MRFMTTDMMFVFGLLGTTAIDFFGGFFSFSFKARILVFSA